MITLVLSTVAHALVNYTELSEQCLAVNSATS
jgi:hypothetical protein